MRFVQYYLDCLSQASYLIGDETAQQSAVVDPRRDIQQYLDDATASGLHIVYVIETHLHADFLSGHLELADATGATVIYGEAADVHFPHRKVVDGERIEMGQVVLEFRATPGHTPESISVVVWEKPSDVAPHAVLTGDTLLIGDVGRPDLGGSRGRTAAESAARQLYHSVHNRLLTLPDDTRVYPAHGAGSACGKNLSNEIESTIGEQRLRNYALQLSVERFVEAVTKGQPPRPDYFMRVAELNREPHQLLDDAMLPQLSLDDVLDHCDRGGVVLDVRSPEAFAQGHLRGSLNVGLEGRFAEYAGGVVPADRDVVLVCEPNRAHEARQRLGRVGFDSVVGVLDRPRVACSERPDIAATAKRLSVRELAAAMNDDADLVVLDVRGVGERASGWIEGSIHIPIVELRVRIGELDPVRPIVAYCAGGYRSSIAASLVRSHGFTDVSDLIGGYQAWVGWHPMR